MISQTVIASVLQFITFIRSWPIIGNPTCFLCNTNWIYHYFQTDTKTDTKTLSDIDEKN